jgi:undecaprenyl-diphosphatase
MLLFGGMVLDSSILIAAYAGDRPELAQAARWVTELGGHLVLVPITIAAALWLLFRRRFRAAAILVGITLVGRFLVEFQKSYTARIRPGEYEHLVPVESLSFPSGHAANSAIVYVALAVLLSSGRPWRPLALWGAVWLSLAIGISRVMLGVHWPSDVIAGWAFGLFWTLLLLHLSGYDLGDGTPRPLRHSSPPKETA